jgi:LCP family protein required for cell wall assembly
MSVLTNERPIDVGDAPPAPRRPSRLKVLAVVAAVLVLLVAGIAALVAERQRTYDRQIERIEGAFPAEPGRPARAPGRAENVLLVGSDRRDDEVTTGQDADEPLWGYGLQRADIIMLVHLPADRDHVYFVSFPRDTWTKIQGHGKAKINAAYSFGGSPLLIATIEQLTGVRIDHFAALDFEGFKSMTDAVGGVNVRVAEPVTDPKRDVSWSAGTHHLDGERALDFVRQRYNLPGGDFDRIKRQHAFLKALGNRAISRSTLANPLRLNSFLEAFTTSVSVDRGLTIQKLRSLALQFRSIRADDGVFMTAPIAGTGTEDQQSVVYLDKAKSRSLFRALRTDEVDSYLTSAGAAVNQVDKVN